MPAKQTFTTEQAHEIVGKLGIFYGLLSNIGGAEMKRIMVSVAITLVIILTTLSLQGCFTPYPAGDYQRGSSGGAPSSASDLGWP